MIQDKTLYQYFIQGTKNAKETKIIFYNNHIVSSELMKDIDAVAMYLKNIGVKEGDSVGISMPNTPHAIVATYAVSKIGGIVNAIHPKISTKGLMKCLTICKAKYLFVLDQFYVTHQEALKQAGIKVIYCAVSDYLKGALKLAYRLTERKSFDSGTPFRIARGTTGNTSAVGNPFAPALYLHSGGTSGEPKTISLTSVAINTLAENIIESGCNGQYDSSDSMLMVLPIFHGFGFVISMHDVIAHGRLVLMPAFDPKHAIKLIKKHKITMLSGVPAMFRKMYDRPEFDGKYLSTLKFLFCGGDKLTESFQNEFNAVMQKNGSSAVLQEGYGLTEVTSVVCVNRQNAVKKGSVGQAIAETEIRIVNENLKTVPFGENGEIVVSSPSMMTEYLGDPVGTEKTMVKIDGKTFVRTGDIGAMDKEGYIYFKDREKRVIKISGVNIFPAEIENIVSNLKEVKLCCVVPTEVDGNTATKLYVVMEEGFEYSEWMEQHIKNKILEETIHYAVPRIVCPVEHLKLTETGKVDIKYYLAKESALK